MAKRSAAESPPQNGDERAPKAAKTQNAKQKRQNSNSAFRNGHSQAVPRFGAVTRARDTGAGQIKQVKVTNFMCHTKMEVDFTEHVNFISGPNGSGKSAILQALQYCLGVRASQTGRGTSNLTYLKKGTDVCTAQVTLWNTGPAYCTFFPEIYGDTITIHKTLTPKGSTTTKVLDARGQKTNITKKDDVDQLLAKLSVNAANPSIVLTQDQARGLLTSPQLRTKLFDLLQESLDFNSTLTYLHASKKDIQEQRGEVEKFAAERKENEQKRANLIDRLEAADQAAEYRELAEDLEDHIAWAVVKYLRAKIAEVDGDLSSGGPAAKQALAEKLAAVEEELAAIESKCTEFDTFQTDLMKRVDDVKAQKEASRTQRKQVMSKKNALANKIKGRSSELRAAQDVQRQAERAAAAVRERGDDQDTINAQLAAWQAKKHDALTASKDSQEAMMNGQKDVDAAMDRCTAANAVLREAQAHVAHVQTELNKMTSYVHAMERSNGPHQHANVFDSQAGLLLEQVSLEQHRFRRPVVGPLGAFLSLKDARFSATICGALAHLLSSYIVDNVEDRKTLQSLARQKRLQEPRTIVMSFSLPQHQPRENQLPSKSVTTIMDVLQVKSGVENAAVIMNVLMDHGQIERIGLAENQDAGQEILNTHHLWQNLARIYCNDREGPVEMRNANGNRSIWPWGTKNQPAPEALLSADMTALLRQRKEQVEQESQKLYALQREMDEKQQQLEASQQDVRETQQRQQQLQENSKRAHALVGQVEQERPEARVSADDELTEALEARDQAMQDILRLGPEVKDLEEQFEDVQKELDEIEAKRKYLHQEAEQFQKEADDKFEFLQRAQRERQEKQLQKDRLHKVAKSQEEAAEEANKVKEDLTTKYEMARRVAEQICTEEEANAEIPTLKARLQKLISDHLQKRKLNIDEVLIQKEDLQHLSKICQKKAELLQRHAGAEIEKLKLEKDTLETKMAISEKQSGRFVDLVQTQVESYNKRKKRFMEIRSDTAQEINQKFKHMLKTGRNWKGRIEVSFEDNSVTLQVTPNKGAHTEGAALHKEMRTLSGGERSFTCVSFILALGQEISTPFFAMDEFDVFMDAVARKVALTSILRFAWELQDTQFILLTPLDMAVVEQSRKDVNDDLHAKANGAKVQEMPSSFIHCVAMQPPREGARAHF